MNLRWTGAAGLVVAAGVLVGGLAGGAAPAPAPLAAPAEPTTFKVDGVHSNVIFRIKHLGVSNFYGRFNEIGGDFTWDASKPEAAKINITIKADSIDSNNKGRDQHLKTPDFFNVKEFPEITFKSTGLSKAGEGWELAGDLTLLGKTKPVKAKFEYLGEKDAGGRFGYRGGFDAQFTFKRSDFGMAWGVENGALGDEVTVMVGIEGTK